MADILTTLRTAQREGARLRPKVGGFPYLAEALRRAGVITYSFDVPSSSTTLITATDAVLEPGSLLHAHPTVVPAFDVIGLQEAIRADQQGEATFPEFVTAVFASGVVRFVIDLNGRTCTYLGTHDERYVENYPLVELPDIVTPHPEGDDS